VTVSLAGWPLGSATVAVCGDNARAGDEDCDLAGARSIDLGAVGTGAATLIVALPVPCPCVVRAATAGGDLVQTLPLQVLGVDAAPGGAAGSEGGRQLAVEARVLPSRSTWSSFFGLSDQGTLEVTVRNVGAVPVDGVGVDAGVGRSARTGRPLAVPPLDRALLPGEQRTVEVPFTLSAPVVGDYVLSGQVVGLDEPVPFRATVESRPWGLLALVVVVGLGAGWWCVVRVRRRRSRPLEPSAAVHDGQVAGSLPAGEFDPTSPRAALPTGASRRYGAVGIDPEEP